MMKKFLLALAATVALVGGTLAAGAPAQATPTERASAAGVKCVDQSEYKAVKVGMTAPKVFKVLHGQNPTYADPTRAEYFACTSWTHKTVVIKWTASVKVKSKALVGGN